MSDIQYKVPPVDIAEDDPFKHDLLKRKESATALTAFVKSLSHPFVLTIDSPWGTGKTTFLKMWSKSLQQEGFFCLFFNAWETDFSESPFVSLVGEIGAAIKQWKIDSSTHPKVEKAVEATKERAIKLARVAPAGVGKLIALIPGGETLAAPLEKMAESLFADYEAKKVSIEEFRKTLTTLVSLLQEASQSKLPVVFIIDELDRCRPTYAIGLLEKIKHLFNVPGLVFVLAMDREQLGESVKSVYGPGFGASGYLRRFIDLEYHFPKAPTEAFVQSLFKGHRLDELFRRTQRRWQEASDLVSALSRFFDYLEFSLRQQEHCFTQLSVMLRIYPINRVYPHLLAVLLCLRQINKDLYFRYCRGQALPEDVLGFLRAFRPHGPAVFGTFFGAQVEAFLITGMRDRKIKDETLKALEARRKAPALEGPERDKIASMFEVWTHHPPDDEIPDYLFKAIELAEPFRNE